MQIQLYHISSFLNLIGFNFGEILDINFRLKVLTYLNYLTQYAIGFVVIKADC
jgi:hypothetical protein